MAEENNNVLNNKERKMHEQKRGENEGRGNKVKF